MGWVRAKTEDEVGDHALHGVEAGAGLLPEHLLEERFLRERLLARLERVRHVGLALKNVIVLEWCTACERCHEKYGTRSAVCRTYPTKSWSFLLSENAPCPHSCAMTHSPVKKAPCHHQ